MCILGCLHCVGYLLNTLGSCDFEDFCCCRVAARFVCIATVYFQDESSAPTLDELGIAEMVGDGIDLIPRTLQEELPE